MRSGFGPPNPWQVPGIGGAKQWCSHGERAEPSTIQRSGHFTNPFAASGRLTVAPLTGRRTRFHPGWNRAPFESPPA
ncbi:MAG: hypothetical protein WBG11_02385 [Methylocella sp.]